MAQIKSYVDLESYDEMTNFAGADAERTVRSYVVTEESGRLASLLLSDLAAARGAVPAIQFVSGERGSGKSHLLAFVRALIGTRSLRSIHEQPRLQSALRELNNKTLIPVELNFPAGEQTSFEAALRASLNSLTEGTLFNDQRWKQAVEREQVFEQTLSLLPLDAQLALFIDHLSSRWRTAPEFFEDDLKWLRLIARQTGALPLRAVIALEERDLQTRLENFDLLQDAQSVIMRSIPPQMLREVIARGVVIKKPEARQKLPALYQQIKNSLPGFEWAEDAFIAYYPVHPALETLAPVIRARARNFSLPGFAAATVTRALNRPELSLVAVDELFDRYEYELRKSEATTEVFALYDRINAEALNKLSGEDRLWAKMLAKALALFLLTEERVEAQTLADSTLLFEGSNGSESGYERAARILAHFEPLISEAITLDGETAERAWLWQAAPPVAPLRERLALAAGGISADDPRLGALLITIGGHIFEDWNPAQPAESLTEPGCRPLPPAVAREIVWRGTARRGRLCLDAAELAFSAGHHPATDDLLDPASSADTHTNLNADDEWRLLIVPFNARLKIESTVSGPDALRWHPGVVTDESALEPLRLLLALQEHDALSEDDPAEVRLITKELHEQIRTLFARLYLERGTFVDHEGLRPMATGFQASAGFAELLRREIGASLDNFYPDHPHFESDLTGEHVLILLTGLFASSSPGSDLTRELAAKFAAPLGLVSESRGKYRLNVFNEAANLPPFIHALVTLVEIHADAEGRSDVPLSKVMRLLGVSPYGLPLAAQHLILVAFISSGVYELVDESTGKRLTKANLHLGFEPARFTTLRRVATTDYPLELLLTWSKRLTGREDLPALISPDARQTVRDALSDWLEQWREQNLRERFEEVPADLMTMTTWHAVNMSIRRYERAAVIVESIMEEALTPETGLSRILDLFGLDIVALEQARMKMQSLAGFLDWLPTFVHLRNYLLAAENTGEGRIDEEWEYLTAVLREPHELLMPESRQQLEESFEDYRAMYTAYYTAAHEASVGPRAFQEMIESFYASAEWQNFKLLTQLKLDGRAISGDARMLGELVEKTRCDLPIADILQRQPHCGCSFRLNRRLNLGSVLDAFRSLTRTATAYYSEEIWKRREELRHYLGSCPDESLIHAVNDFLNNCGEGSADGLTQKIVSFLNQHLPDLPLVAVLPEIPRFDESSFTREQLRENLNRWIDSLPAEEGLRFRVERA
jgi:hypothetical protein